MKRQKTYLPQVSACLRTSVFLLASALWLPGCSDNPDQPHPVPAERVPIELHATGTDVTSKAETGTTGITRSFGTTVFATNESGNYTGLTDNGNYKWVKNTTVQTSGALSLPGNPVYPNDDADIYLVAVAPQAAASYNSSNGTVTCTLDGQTDLMFAPQIAGNRKDGYRFSGNTSTASDKPLTYSHRLTQLTFKAKKTGTGTVTVKSLSVKATPTATLTLADGSIVFGGTAAPMILKPSGDAGKEVSGTGTTDLGALLLPPLDMSTDSPYKVTVETSDKTYTELPIAFDSNQGRFAAGYSYEITLNFKTEDGETKELEILSVSVAPWTPNEISGDLTLTE
ncbi:fimbrillin family protein [Parabacteroides sp.]